MDIREFVAKWAASSSDERANAQHFLTDLCDVLAVDRPRPSTGNPQLDLFAFEHDALIPVEGGRVSVGKIDLFKAGHFVLEAKQGSEAGSSKLGTAKRNTASWNIAMRDAFGQALGYARTLDEPPPFIITCDVGFCFDLYASFDGTANYRPFPDALHSRIYLSDLKSHTDLVRKIFTDPLSLDPAKISAKVTSDIATHIANLARDLDGSGEKPETVAKFLMRCLFTMFAEDVELLPKRTFAHALQEWIEDPKRFRPELEALWQTMNVGGSLPFVGKIWRFNGGLFADPSALPLSKDQIILLALAAESNWAEVEPAIFGTLLERALDPKERHRLGAHYTPRAYVERLVRPTLEEPLRERWELVQAEVRQIIAQGKDDRRALVEARKPVYAFYDYLCGVRVLDPACGSGNFLFVALDTLKRIENEILDLLHDLGDNAVFNQHGRPVTPEQFLGLEVKPWAKEITELVLWIGYLQWQIRTRGWTTAVPEPVLRDYQNIECRDAILDWDRVEPLVDVDGTVVTRWDGESTRVHPVTGDLVPDERARVPVMRYVGPRKARWPKADFIVGNPPFVGDKMMKQTFGLGYVTALRDTYPNIPESADYVMYWWDAAAKLVVRGAVQRFGFIATNSLRQTFNRRVIEKYLDQKDISLVFAVPDHPWTDESDGADVRISMTVGTAGVEAGDLHEISVENDELLAFHTRHGRINADLTVGADVSSAEPLKANRGVSCVGVKLFGQGFLLSPTESKRLKEQHHNWHRVIRPYLIARDLITNKPPREVIDCFGLSEAEVREELPGVYQYLLAHVKPERDANARASYRDKWWIFGEPRKNFRPWLRGLSRFIVTPETSKHRFFSFMEAEVVAEGSLVMIASDEASLLAVLSSRVHETWSLKAGGRLGVGNDPRYNKSRCFDPFPFPVLGNEDRDRLTSLGERLHSHRKRQQEAFPGTSLTAIYNVLEKLRVGEILSDQEVEIHQRGLVSILKQIHDEIDEVVFGAYGWSLELRDDELLARLVDLNMARADEERRGLVRWLRPDVQNATGTEMATEETVAIEFSASAAVPAARAPKPAWPKALPDQLLTLRTVMYSAVERWTIKSLSREFDGGNRRQIEAALESLEALGLVVSHGEGDTRMWTALRSVPHQRRFTPLTV